MIASVTVSGTGNVLLFPIRFLKWIVPEIDCGSVAAGVFTVTSTETVCPAAMMANVEGLTVTNCEISGAIHKVTLLIFSVATKDNLKTFEVPAGAETFKADGVHEIFALPD